MVEFNLWEIRPFFTDPLEQAELLRDAETVGDPGYIAMARYIIDRARALAEVEKVTCRSSSRMDKDKDDRSG